MESIISAMEALNGALNYIKEASEGEVHKMAVEAIELAESIMDAMGKMTATREQTAAIIENAAKNLRPIENEAY